MATLVPERSHSAKGMMMSCFDRAPSRRTSELVGCHDELNDRKDTGLPAAAQHSLDRIAEALNVTTALLSQAPSAVKDQAGKVRLAEATELLQAFIRIEDVEARRRCLEFVKSTAFAQQPNRI
ncbi:hypothetical protein U8607_21965 [Methylobacterium durans]|uniref:hypothetical protein n=1 Tax=Methylobacterium durans TaxID=2202825 RepID=UPI002AFDE051|nr:hypothetical protein [Methylobacterium durans]MEA1834765.1 hypothetical protein [Methylobacterium durans]